PPDAISQTLLALPMWMLFEAGLLFSRTFARKRNVNSPDVNYDDSL
ncbi:MAG: twin-arginine translocase subunit TatC, partial [Gammaproteobacteria bacterium]